MKFIRVLLVALFMVPFAARAASSDFMVAAQLLAAAKNADIQQVQALVNNGADINFVDATGLSLVCTALMNNDVRAAQILQMYGADASKCDRQIKQYNSANKPRSTGGLFSGLSSTQGMALAAAGAAVVIGGLFLLTDVFDAGNENETAVSGSGNRPGQGDSGGNSGSLAAAFTLPYGPAMVDATAEQSYGENLNFYSPANPGVDSTGAQIFNSYYENFQLMSNGNDSDYKFAQNYLLMMHGYSPLARGYMGMRTLRRGDHTPFASSTLQQDFSIGDLTMSGGRPVGVALITANGGNAAAKPAGATSAEKNSLDDKVSLWTTVSGDTVVSVANTYLSNLASKYYNNKIVPGASTGAELTGMYTVEDASKLSTFDLAGFGTVVNNTSATVVDDLLAKIVAGSDTGYGVADFFGFMPNGQLAIFRTGAGSVMVAVTGTPATGTYNMVGDAWAVGDTLDLFGRTLTVTAVNGNQIVATATGGTTDYTYNAYIGTDGLLYIDSNADGAINQAYSMSGGVLTQTKELTTGDYLNYDALVRAAALYQAGDVSDGYSARSRPDVFANASVIAPLHTTSAKGIDDVLAAGATSELRRAQFKNFVNDYYDVDNDDDVGVSADWFFNDWLGRPYSPLVIFSTGAVETDSSLSGKTYTATFENAAPLTYSGLEHLFMSVAAVRQSGTGTSGAMTVNGYTPANKYELSYWSMDGDYYKARACGVAGTGANGVDPWCFAAAGVTDELAVSAAAGAAGAVKSAFSYLSNQQVFALLALTADGPYLGTDVNGNAYTKDALISYLDSMYKLPNDYQNRVDSGADYLEVFKEVFGYGLINLERATTPTTAIYYYNGTDIVSAGGNAYWRAATNTTFSSSAALNPRVASISAPFYDVLESIDGDMSLPRVWENEFSLGMGAARGLYMGDVLGDLKTRKEETPRVQIGNLGFSVAVSERAYVDNMGGLDNLQFDYSIGNVDLAAGYQHYFTNGASRFDGMSNPVLGLATNAVTSDVVYNSGAWSFGAHAFSGAITDEELLENDPTIASQYEPARLGLISGAGASIARNGERFGFTTSVGAVRESDTLLGAQTGGLLNLGAGRTTYVDSELRWGVADGVDLTARATFAHTTSDASGEFILGLTDLYSDAFAIGADIGNFSLSVSRPLAVRRGAMQYAYADYDVTEDADGNYDLVVRDAYIADVPLASETRELRINASYRRSLGEFTDGAIGFIYRHNPDNTDEFGDEGIFMLKFHHRLGV